jgi:hypothetical protein
LFDGKIVHQETKRSVSIPFTDLLFDLPIISLQNDTRTPIRVLEAFSMLTLDVELISGVQSQV